jgi:hypothetical protein
LNSCRFFFHFLAPVPIIRILNSCISLICILGY